MKQDKEVLHTQGELHDDYILRAENLYTEFMGLPRHTQHEYVSLAAILAKTRLYIKDISACAPKLLAENTKLKSDMLNAVRIEGELREELSAKLGYNNHLEKENKRLKEMAENLSADKLSFAEKIVELETENTKLMDINRELVDALKIAMASLGTYGPHPIIESQAKAAIEANSIK